MNNDGISTCYKNDRCFFISKKEMIDLEFLIFTVGVIVGGLFGMTTLCLVQINRQTENELRKAEHSLSEVGSETEN